MTSPTAPVDTQTKHTPVIDESERRATVVVNQRAYDVPLDVATELARLGLDAERYRWLCLMAWGVPQRDGINDLTFRTFTIERWTGTTKEVADKAIDAARHPVKTI